jgi:hypothetical protein
VFAKTRVTKEAVTVEHGCSTLAQDEAGRVLDRLLLLEEAIGRDFVLQALRDTHCFDSRSCVLTREVTFWVVLAMGILTTMPIRQVFKFARSLRHGENTPDRSSLCLARQRLGLAPVRRLFQLIVRPLATAATKGAFYQGLRLMALDGTVMNVPDTPANAKAFGRTDGARGESAFPQVRKLSLVEVGTHAEVALVVRGVRGAGSSESAMAPALFKHLRAGMLLLWDRGFFAFSLWKMARARGVEILGRVPQHAVLKPTLELSDGSYLAKIYPNDGARRNQRDGIVVRVIRYTIDDPQRVGHQQVHVLITTLRDAERDPALKLVLLYHERWEIELVFDEQKTHQDPRRASKPAQLRSGTPAGVLQEIYALSLGHFVTRKLMHEAALREDLDPDRLSFTGCLHILRTRLPECRTMTQEQLRTWCDLLLAELGRERTEERRNRINPRVIKQKMSKFKKKRPEHRPVPPLKKTFAESVLVLR